MNGDSERYATTGGDLTTEIVETVAAASGKDPLEMDPLYETVDPDALQAAIEGMNEGEVSFTMDGVNVTVTSSGEVVVGEEEESTAGLDGAIADASNVLLLAPPRGSHDDEACLTFASRRPPEETDLLGITYARDAYNRLDLWGGPERAYPANTSVVDVGTRTRSAAADSTGTIDFPTDPFTIRTVANETDLATIGRLATEELSAWADSENRTTACFHSVSDLLDHVSEETAFKFLHVLTSRFESEGVCAHYHMERDAHDEETVRTFSELFDAVVEVGENGTWTIDARE